MINVTRSSMPDYQEYCEEIKDLWDSHWLTNMGTKHKEFQKKLEDYLGVPHVSLYTNGHLALEAAWEWLDLPAGGEVITTPFTFCSTTHAMVRKGLVPVFCDVDPDTYCMDANRIEALITDRTVALCPVHVYGRMCDVEKIGEIARKHGLKVVYDAAHAFGVTYKGISAACFGDVSMFSFHATKVFNTIEGGALCFSDDAATDVLNERKNFGIHGPESTPYVGGNAKMNEFQAAMGICNLRHLDAEIERRKAVSERYCERLGATDGIKIPEPQKDVVSNYAYFPVIFDGFRKTRNAVFEQLKQRDVIARKYFYPLVNSMQCYADYPSSGAEKTPVAGYVSDRVLTLPLYADLSPADVDRICDMILSD